jgi:hypothetical protein
MVLVDRYSSAVETIAALNGPALATAVLALVHSRAQRSRNRTQRTSHAAASAMLVPVL